MFTLFYLSPVRAFITESLFLQDIFGLTITAC